MTVTVAAFYADQFGQPSRFNDYLPLILASRHALAQTNPGARYVVLTDPTTAALLDQRGIDHDVVCTEHMPLMSKIIFAQRAFMKRCDSDLIVLPDVDTLTNRSLSGATHENHGLVITHRGRKWGYRINNVAYVRDRDLASWFLDRAYSILEGWPRDKREWEGDQEAWQSALGIPIGGLGYYVWVERLAGEIFVAYPEDKPIHLYPCTTHNCMMSNDGALRPVHKDAFLLHLKGPRKKYLSQFMMERFGADISESS